MVQYSIHSNIWCYCGGLHLGQRSPKWFELVWFSRTWFLPLISFSFLLTVFYWKSNIYVDIWLMPSLGQFRVMSWFSGFSSILIWFSVYSQGGFLAVFVLTFPHPLFSLYLAALLSTFYLLSLELVISKMKLYEVVLHLAGHFGNAIWCVQRLLKVVDVFWLQFTFDAIFLPSNWFFKSISGSICSSENLRSRLSCSFILKG